MPKVIKTIAFISVSVAIVTTFLYHLFYMKIFLTLAITFGTTAYHFIMRLVVGIFVNMVMHNHADYYKKWYQVRFFEKRLYTVLKVKQWKNKMPTYHLEQFSLKKHTLDKIAQTMCQSEIVHEIIVVFSFLPLLETFLFGDFFIFFVTSFIAAAFDMMFVIIQRYNRSRIIKILEKGKS